MKHKKLLLSLFLALFFILSCNESEFSSKKPKYIFFFIGDGMGLAHVNLTEAYLSSLDDSIGVEKLSMNQFPVFGMSTTFAENRYITGSAAAGTALATGFKTSINTISLKSNHIDTLYSIAYYAKKSGMKIGIMSSVGINHATPAVFYAHQQYRNQYYEIAVQLAKSGFDLFGGGGFIEPTGKDKNLYNAYQLAIDSGYQIIFDNEKLKNATNTNKKTMLVSPVILDNAEFPYAIDQKKGFFTLADFTSKAIELLDNKNGFFMMVEGGKIDWASHSNDAATLIQEVIDFDNAVKVAYEFYKKHPDETLIIVTADHETGGLTVGWNDMHYESNFPILQNQKSSVGVISDSINEFLKTEKNVTIDDIIAFGATYFDIQKETLNENELKLLQNAYSEYINPTKENEGLYEKNNYIADTWIKIFDQRAGIGWASHSHTGVPVPVYSIGVGSELFDGSYDNTDIPRKIAEIIGVKIQD